MKIGKETETIECKIMSPKELESYILKKNTSTQKWDSEPSDKTIHVADFLLSKEY